jgi:hypothetical protein
MKAIEVRTQHQETNEIKYKGNIKNAIIFLRNDEDKITVRNREQVEIEVYNNGELIFSGDKTEFYNKLKL